MALGKSHDVICVSCHQAVHTLYAYPENTCAVEARTDIGEVQCCKNPEHRGDHYDEFLKVQFKTPGKLKKSAEGNVLRP